jgi:alpha-tubulin suppressor-like RCC1 family protein
MCIFALTGNGEIYSWGYNEYGELGHGDTSTGPKPPIKIEGILSGVKIVKIAAGSDHTLAISDNGTLYSWGFNSDGQLGSGSESICEMSPKKIVFKGRPQTKVISAAAGMFHSAAVTVDGIVSCKSIILNK